MPGSSELTADSIARRRLRVQRLDGTPFLSAPEVVRHLLAVQSQDYPGGKWALGQRLAEDAADASEAAIDALFDAGAIVRTHVLRPTWHFVDPADLRWLLALTAPRVHQASGYQYRTLGLDEATRSRGRAVLERALAGGRSMTREELGRVLTEAGLPADGLRLGYFLMDAELEAVICSGPRRGKRHTYALLEERLPPAPPRERDEALAELARRYVEGHGPAQAADLSWWSGLTLADARRALAAAEPAIRRESVGERTFWSSPTEPPPTRHDGPLVHLLPNYDELLIAFRDRGDAADPDLPPAARVAQVILAHVIVRDGLVVGGWRRVTQGASLEVEANLLVDLDEDARRALGGAASRLSRFLGGEVRLTGVD